MAAGCPHRDVTVDYDHPHGTIEGVLVSHLQETDPTSSRPIMTLRNPRCHACLRPLSRAELRDRIRPGGDLHDPRFLW